MQLNESPKQQLTADEALDVLSDRSHLHPNTEKFFGPELTKELLDILEDPEIFELDAMLLQGDLTIAEMEEYLMLLPTFHDLNKRLRDWADKLIARITKNLPRILSESIDRKGRYTDKQGLVKTQKNLFEMVYRFCNFGQRTERNALVLSLRHYLQQELTMEIWFQVTHNPALNKYRPLLETFFKQTEQGYQKNFGHSYPGTYALQCLADSTGAYVKNRKHLDTLIKEGTSAEPDITEEELAKKISDDFSVINEMSHFRSIYPITQKLGNSVVEIYSDPNGKDSRISTIAYVKIAFPGADPNTRIATSKDSQGAQKLSITFDQNTFQFLINRNTGDLNLHASAIFMDKEVKRKHGHPYMSEQEYMRLKAIIFSMLRRYLEQKPEDIDKVFFCKTEQPQALREQTKEQVEETIKPTQEPVKPTWVYTPYQPEQTPQQSPEQEEAIIQDVHLDGTYSQEQTIAAICRITKIQPLKSARSKSRGKGSHVVVQGQNGARFPLPCHAGKDLADPILKRCLQKLQIRHSVFKAEY